MSLIFFSKCSKFDVDVRNGEKKIDKILWVGGKTSFELISINTNFCRERILVIASPYVNKHSPDSTYY